MHLRREAPDPLYLQIKQTLIADIRSGTYRSHQRLPSERELATQYNVSRMTVRQALLDLVRDGTVYTRVGLGTFVADPKIDQQLRTLTGFSQEVLARGSQPASQVLRAEMVPAAEEVSTLLRLAPATPVYLLARLRLADDLPLAIETAYLIPALCPGLFEHDFASESLYDVLENAYGLILTEAEQSIEAALAEPHELRLLELAAPAPVLRMQRLTLASDGRPVECVHSTYRGDRYKFRSTLRPRMLPV